jgi:hypothetical protein
MNGQKKKISLLIALLMLISSFTSCSDNSQEAESTEETESVQLSTADETAASEETDETEEERIKPNIPESADFGGDTITFLHWYNSAWTETVRQSRDIYSEGLTGEAINDAVYNRNIKIEDAYNVKIALQLEQSTEIASTVDQQVTSGDNTYDVVYQVLSSAPALIQKSYFHNLFNVPNIDLSQPWWDQNSINSLSTMGILPLVSTSINVNDKDATAAIAFNKTIASNNQLEDIYTLVREGKWTYDKLAELAEATYNDSNGDGTMTPDDIYGFLGGRDVIDSLYHGSGSQFVTKNEDDEFIFSFGTERDIDAVTKGIDIVNSVWYFNHHAWTDQSDILYRQIFETGHGLFFWMRLDDVTNMRAGEADFGIIPIPKYDEAQDNYYSLVSQHTTGLMSIPITCAGDELSEVGMILEALAAESHYTLIPEYIETSLKTKNSRDAESADMLDIILNNRVFDPMNVYSFANFGDAIMDAADANNKDIASLIKSKEKIVNKSIERLLDAMSEVE